MSAGIRKRSTVLSAERERVLKMSTLLLKTPPRKPARVPARFAVPPPAASAAAHSHTYARLCGLGDTNPKP
jgi:hypothetical protein